MFPTETWKSGRRFAVGLVRATPVWVVFCSCAALQRARAVGGRWLFSPSPGGRDENLSAKWTAELRSPRGIADLHAKSLAALGCAPKCACGRDVSYAKNMPPACFLNAAGCLRRRRMRARTVQGIGRRKSLPLGSPHPSRLRRATFPQRGKAFDGCKCRGPNNHQGSALQARKEENSDPLASVSRTK